MFKKTTIPNSCLTISNRVKSGKIRFDLEVQRRAVWNLEQKQNLIDSIIFDYPIPPLYFVDKNDNYMWMLDGQQRCRAIAEYINDEFSLSNNICNYIDEEGNHYDLTGKKYSELDKTIQTAINSTNIVSYNFTNITENEISVMFKRLNSGTPFKKIELVRVDAGSEVSGFINEISNMEFFKTKTTITDKAKIHFTDHEVILQTLAIVSETNSGFSGKELNQFALDLKAGILDDELKTRIISITGYLNETFPEKCKYIKKVNIPVIFKVAEMALNNNIDAVDFFDWINGFFTDKIENTMYQETVVESSSKKEQVQKRMRILVDEFNKQFKIAA
jgi:hypothetical protein